MVDEITTSISEKTQKSYVKIVSTEGNCFMCFDSCVFEKLIKLLEIHNLPVELSGEVSQKKGGTYLSVKKVSYRDTSGEHVCIDNEIAESQGGNNS